MSPSLPSCLALALLLLAAPAAADDLLSRRVAALEFLVRGTRSVAPAPASPESAHAGCAKDAWWRRSPAVARSRGEVAVRRAAVRFGIDEALLRSVIRQESAWDPDAVSHKGAMGLMQLMPATARLVGVSCAFDPRQNVMGGARYLRRMRDRLGSWPRAVAAYHCGPGRVESGRIPEISRAYAARVLQGWRPSRYAEIHFD